MVSRCQHLDYKSGMSSADGIMTRSSMCLTNFDTDLTPAELEMFDNFQVSSVEIEIDVGVA